MKEFTRKPKYHNWIILGLVFTNLLTAYSYWKVQDVAKQYHKIVLESLNISKNEIDP